MPDIKDIDDLLNNAQEMGYRKGLIKGRELQKQEDVSEFLKDILGFNYNKSTQFYENWVRELIEKWEKKKNE